ncbi:MAG: hypothetical protein ACRDRD_19010 [Pseudonocardiaceae bacterium]
MLRELDGTVRYLIDREAAMAQGFPPPKTTNPRLRSQVMGVIGNAVAANVVANLGDALREAAK